MQLFCWHRDKFRVTERESLKWNGQGQAKDRKKHGIYSICSSIKNECCTKLCDHNVDESNDGASISQIDAGHNDPQQHSRWFPMVTIA